MKINEGQGQGQGDKAMPQGAKVMMAILKDMNIVEYEPRVVEQLLEFSYRYISSVLEDSKVLSQHARKKAIDIDDVKLAVAMYTEHNLTNPPTRDVLLEVASRKNNTPLPIPKASGGMRLPPDRYCLTACNYKLKPHKKRGGGGGAKGGGAKGGVASAAAAGATGFTMKTLPGGKAGQPQANIRINPVTSSASAAAGAPRIQIQAQPGTGTGGQPMFSMTVNPAALAGGAAASATSAGNKTGIKRSADQMS